MIAKFIASFLRLIPASSTGWLLLQPYPRQTKRDGRSPDRVAPPGDRRRERTPVYHRGVTRRAVTYASYLKVPELLSLQVERSTGADGPEHDELLFIVVHQVYELWFKSLHHELQGVQIALEDGDTDRALHLMNRVLKILKTLVAQVDVLETMTPTQFLSFRDRLESASGFESAGFRTLEAMLGERDQAAVEGQPAGSLGRQSIEDAQSSTSVWESFLGYLAERGHAIPTDADAPDPRVQDVLIAAYAEDADAALVAERLVDLDEGVQEWRYRHVKMVERTIGAKAGTGGSPGAAYLRTTLSDPAFPDLWAIRSAL
jgi:tryptophan 2,3-dioxygenase